MAKTAKITLGGVEYEIHKLNVGELEQVTDILSTVSQSLVPFAVLRIAMKRATPAVDVGSIEADPEEIRDAVTTILSLTGMAPAKDGDQPGEGRPATAA